jgi:hypothetical protein
MVDHAERYARAVADETAGFQDVELTLKLAAETMAEVRARERGATLAEEAQWLARGNA